MSWKITWREYGTALKQLVMFAGVLVLIELIDKLVFHDNLFLLGVQRGDFAHWYRIFLAPFFHEGWSHVFSNAIGLVLLGSMVLVLGRDVLALVTFSAIVVGGLGILFFGKAGVHAGASGIVYGYFGFLVVFAIYERSVKAIVLAVLVLVLFNGLLRGMLPGGDPTMSWEGHLFGALGGVAAAGTLTREARRKRLARDDG